MRVTFSKLGRFGRLGNQMFQIASTIGIATKNHASFGFPIWRDNISKKNVHQYFRYPLPGKRRDKYQRLEIEFGYHDIHLERSADISGYLQSERYFEHCTDLVRRYFNSSARPTHFPDAPSTSDEATTNLNTTGSSLKIITCQPWSELERLAIRYSQTHRSRSNGSRNMLTSALRAMKCMIFKIIRSMRVTL